MKKAIPFIIPLSIFLILSTLTIWFNHFRSSETAVDTEVVQKRTINPTFLIGTSREYVQEEIETATYYVSVDNARVRSCPSFNCEVLGYFNVNDKIVIESDRHDLAADWIAFKVGDSSETVYIHESVISDKATDIKSVVFLPESKKLSADRSAESVFNDWLVKNLRRLEEKGEVFKAVDLLNYMDRNGLLVTMDDQNFDIALKRMRESQSITLPKAGRSYEINFEEIKTAWIEFYNQILEEQRIEKERMESELRPLELEYARIQAEADAYGCNSPGFYSGEHVAVCREYNNKLIDLSYQQSLVISSITGVSPSLGDFSNSMKWGVVSCWASNGGGTLSCIDSSNNSTFSCFTQNGGTTLSCM
jgi:hypothetical protein